MAMRQINIMNNTVVYRHIKPCGEVFYVGIGCEQRPYDKRPRNQFWARIVNKYRYEVEVVATGLSWEMACELEELMILEYGRIDLGTGTLVNMTAGGDGTKGRVCTTETRQKLSAVSKGKPKSEEHRQKISAAKIGENNPMYGKKLSEETKQKMSAASKGKPSEKRKLTFEQAEEIRQRYKNEKITYDKLAQEYGVVRSVIWSIINNETYTKP